MKKLFNLLITIIIMVSSDIKAQNDDVLYYIGDPMCSWCYGFGPELDSVLAAYPNAKFEMIMGGLRPGGNESMDDLRDFLTDHWKEVELRTGQKFNHGILKKSGFMYDTEPACKAVTLVRKLFPRHEYMFFKKLQYAFYHDNESPLSVDTYKAILQSLKLETKDFEKLIYKDDAKDFVNQDFEKARAMGVTGFPTLIAKINGKFYKLSNGYSEAKSIINRLEDREFNK